jgi:predicted phosphodiesterase
MIAVISDVHANLAALDAVLRDIRQRGIERIYCLGDCIGYSAFPSQTITLLREAGVVSIKGNHDMMATGELPVARCGPAARTAILWTKSVLSVGEWLWLRALPEQLEVEPDMLLLHSGLDDPLGYLINDDDYLEQHRAIRRRHPGARLCFTGHTHKPRLVAVGEDVVTRLRLDAGVTLDPSRFHFINPGSVGHPRISDYRATYATFDPTMRRVEWHRVAYDKARTRAANRRHGITTDLGPGVVRHALRAWAARCRQLLGNA